MDAVDAAVIDSVNGTGHLYSNGLTIYFPEDGTDEEPYPYADINFASATNWDEFLQEYYLARASDTTSPKIAEIECNYEGEIPVLNPGDTITINTTINTTITSWTSRSYCCESGTSQR